MAIRKVINHRGYDISFNRFGSWTIWECGTILVDKGRENHMLTDDEAIEKIERYIEKKYEKEIRDQWS